MGRLVASKAKDWYDPAGSEPALASVRSGSATLACVPWQALEAEVSAWDKLALDAAEPNPFFESWYLLPSLRHLPETEHVRFLRFEHDGLLAGLMPVVRDWRYYGRPLPNMASWLHPNCFCGVPLVARGSEAAFWRALLDWADREAGAALFLHLRGIVLGGPLHAALQAVAELQGRQVALVHDEARAMLASDLSPDAYLEASLTGKKRKELRRQASRLADEGAVRFERRSGQADLDAWCDAFLDLERKGWKGNAGSALACSDATAALFRESLRGAAERGRLERLALLLDDQRIAMLVTFLTAPGAYSFKTAFDENYARFSPGVLLQRENLAVLERPEIAWTDSCAASDHPMIDHLWRERRHVGRLSVAIGGRARRAAFRLLARAETGRRSPGPTL